MLARVPVILWPHLTWRYILASGFTVYAVACFIRGSPLHSSNLPEYTGPCSVGTIDIEAPCEPRTVSDFTFKETGQPAFQVGLS